MKLLLTNDDGIEAPGLAALIAAARGLGPALVVAPHEHLSGCSHQATTHRGLSIREVENGRHALDGTPVDCTRVALMHLAPDVDWVLAGINAGGNLGADVYLSGTVAAVREAALLGRPGIAVSKYVRRLPIDWDAAARWTAAILPTLRADPLAPGEFWNVNLPDPAEPVDLPELRFCPLDPHPLPVEFRLEDGLLHYRGRYQDRRREPGCDVDLCFAGYIAVTRLRLNSLE